MNKKTKKIFVKTSAIFYLFLIFFLVPFVSKAEALDTGQYIYGLSKTMTCGDFEKKTGEMSLSAQVLSVYKQVFNAQCLKQDPEEIYYTPPGELSKATTLSGGMKCSEIQRQLIQAKANDQSVPSNYIDIYNTECLSVVAPKSLDETSLSKYAPIQLGAPIPIEGGDKIEASNKSYLFTYMVKLYRFVLGIAGVAAVIEIIIAGFMIVLAAGDSGRVEEGKKRMIQTLEGIGILFTSAVILNTINPVGYNWEAEIYTLDEIVSSTDDNSGQNDIYKPTSSTYTYKPQSLEKYKDKKSAAAIVGVAISQFGFRETGVNCTPYNLEMASQECGLQWCAIFAHWVYKTAGFSDVTSKIFSAGSKQSFANLENNKSSSAKAIRVGKVVDGNITFVSHDSPEPGDMVIFSRLAINGNSGHAGIVVNVWEDNGKKYFRSIEGNMGEQVKCADHEVNEIIKTRTKANEIGYNWVVGFGRINGLAKDSSDLQLIDVLKTAPTKCIKAGISYKMS